MRCISAMLGLFGMMFLELNCDILCLYFYKSLFTAVILPNFYHDLTSTFLDYSWQNLVGLFVQNHVCHQFPAHGLPEDRRKREKRPTDQNHGSHSHCGAQCGSI
jgi:hypothetical protein